MKLTLTLAAALLCILSPAYAQDVTEDILFVKSVSLAPSTMIVSPQKAETPKVIKGVIFPGVQIEAIKKINYSLKTAQGAVVWERTITPSPKGQTLPFVFDLSTTPLQKELILNAELLIAGDIAISNTDATITFSLEAEGEADPFILSEISNIEITPQEDSLDVSFQFRNNNAEDEFKAVVLFQAKDTNSPYSQLKQSELVTVGAGENNTYAVSFEKPTQPQLYTLSVKVLDKTEQPVTGTVSREWFLEGVIAKTESLTISPLRAWQAGEEVTLSLKGSSRAIQSSLTALIQIRSLEQSEGEWMVSETVSIIPDKEGTFSHDYTFLTEESASQLTAKVTLSQGDTILHERQFESPLFATEGVAKQAVIKMEQLSKKLKTISPQQRLAALGGGVLLVLLLLLFIILAARSRKKKNTINLFLIALMAFGFAANVNAEEVSILYPYFAEEQYNANDITYFDTIPFRGILFDTLAGGAFDPDASAITGEIGFSTIPFDPAPPHKVPFSFSPLSEAEFAIQSDIGGSGIPDGNYFVIIYFKTGVNPDFYSGTVALQWGEQADGTIKTILIDSVAPTISVTPSTTEPTNQPISITVDSSDSGAGEENPSGDVFSVIHNFCTDAEICNTDIGSRTIKSCDKVGNCSEEIIEVSNYDIAAPTFGFVSAMPQQKAAESFEINLTNVDEPVQYPDPTARICSSGTSFFYNNTKSLCEERLGVCALSVTARGTIDRITGECTPSGCQDGYEFNSTTNECEPNICTTTFPFCFQMKFDGSCTETQWLPDLATICEGESFIQTSNCGNMRNSTGTKTDGACIVAVIDCYSDAECDDSNDLTIDECLTPGVDGAVCKHITIECAQDTDCDDSDPATTDTCIDPVTVGARCEYVPIQIGCSSDTDCETSENCLLGTGECVSVVWRSDTSSLYSGTGIDVRDETGDAMCLRVGYADCDQAYQIVDQNTINSVSCSTSSTEGSAVCSGTSLSIAIWGDANAYNSYPAFVSDLGQPGQLACSIAGYGDCLSAYGANGEIIDCSSTTSVSGVATCESTCTPFTCADLGATCGIQDAGCGQTVDCGGCNDPRDMCIANTCAPTAEWENTQAQEKTGNSACVDAGFENCLYTWVARSPIELENVYPGTLDSNVIEIACSATAETGDLFGKAACQLPPIRSVNWGSSMSYGDIECSNIELVCVRAYNDLGALISCSTSTYGGIAKCE